jgi:hypothetical protein
MNPRAICKHLRTKSMYIPALAQAAPSEGPEQVSSQAYSHSWCNCTLTETGPDDRPVGPERCRAGRDCFRE